ncbi:MAG: P-II family nitrogen regulator [Candidatus Omnitrophica bacterium]|nr:MAG: Nitrogen regulatory protein P-II 1 [Candidatus Hinthialibacteria bacterium OLB16]MBE7488147.1 P-II family nitrogen regulator [bacterium]MBW7938089.1 P-II family nitrogen regulator [Candidatus Omnitrophota bacterium]MCE7907817.1 P-II family nitrogen regulator [Candidatus Omnitrophica bacterium COP1]MBV6482734.1 Nitrogen regulatory protein P-II 1 [bacterium]
MKMITAIIRPSKLDNIKELLSEMGVTGLTITEVRGHGRQKGHRELFRGKEYVVDLVPKVRLEIALPDSKVEAVVAAIQKAAHTGEVGDGKVFIMDLENCVRIRTNERGEGAL